MKCGLGFSRASIEGQPVREDGQLAHVMWESSQTGTKGYSFSYDKSGQMTAADLLVQNDGVWTSTTGFAEKGLSYDKNGNILTLTRTDAGGALLHNLSYHYDGNALTSLTLGDGSATEAFLYDANGNMIYDGNTGVGIEYNELNLPARIFDGTNEIRYIYNASGEKLASATGSSLTYYRSVMVYTQSDGGPEQLAHMLQPEGLVQFNGASAGDSYTYTYFKTDHLGSTRAVLAAVWDEASNGYAMNVEQATDYYPFGLAHELNDLGVNRYLFSGKELQDVSLGSLGLLGMYDFGSRYYNPYLGRWFGIDPALQLTNPYIYCGNNPMMFVDPDGEFFFSLFIPILGPILDAACWGATIGAASYTMSVAFSPGGFNNWSWGQFGKSAGIGALQGIATMGVGEIFGETGNFLREAGRGLSHCIVSGGSSALSGGDFLSGFASGALGSWAGHGANALGLTNTVAGALAYSSVAAGIGAWAAGGSFLQGAANGLMVGFLNQVQHQAESAKDEKQFKKTLEKI